MKRLLRVGSRESKLAVIQARLVIDTIRRHHPELEFELVTMKTSGDVLLDRNLDEVGGKGLFVKELDVGLRSGRIDFAVHSLKDMPMETPEDLPVAALTKRENPFDALVMPEGAEKIDLSKPFGCSSARRTLQLQRLYPGSTVKGIRGNVLLRLQKVDSGEYAATVLACAGLNRMGLQGRVTRVFTENEMIPAAGQGILAVQGRAGEDHGYLACVDNEEARIAYTAENAFIRRLDGGCSSPIAAYARLEGGSIRLFGLHYDEESGRHATGTMAMPAGDAETLGYALAEQLLKELRA
ncbi:hydroxymethylbilane synthase [Sporobacter termitidis DSM 10068]|uniref:Porphobilinogen deaminase n=1 Tax=Sporobacter termitidis DSM 10068 TaxID=1123282 RepID=A0A1M5XJU8_9FIRM|nr:hydroxymethylbilane synthase [Sporobacter termitidis]SHH99912.1 hydroxymethylbilane synthase [Sporobacter termitidis DSM 10068]